MPEKLRCRIRMSDSGDKRTRRAVQLARQRDDATIGRIDEVHRGGRICPGGRARCDPRPAARRPVRGALRDNRGRVGTRQPPWATMLFASPGKSDRPDTRSGCIPIGSYPLHLRAPQTIRIPATARTVRTERVPRCGLRSGRRRRFRWHFRPILR